MCRALEALHGPDVHAGVGTYGAWLAFGRFVIAIRVILFGIVAAQLADALTFTAGVSRFGISLESNGFAGALFDAAGLGAVLAAKGAVILATVAMLVATADRFPRLLVWGGAAATSMGLLGFIANAWSLAIVG